jgi:glycosyltransferase EpsD
VGINGERFKPVSRERKLELRHEFGIPDNAFVMIFPAMFIGRKHHDKLLEVMRILTEAVSDMYLLLPGEGEILEQVRESAAEFGDHVKFVGHVSNMEDYYAASDIDVTMSRLEGLATHIIEAMSVGLPCVATMMRGHSDIVSDGVNGFLVAPGDTAAFADRVLRLYNDRATLAEFGGHAGATAKKFWVENIIPDYKRLYSEVLGIDDEL